MPPAPSVNTRQVATYTESISYLVVGITMYSDMISDIDQN